MMNQQPNRKTVLLRYALAMALIIPSVLLNPAFARQKNDTLQETKLATDYSFQMTLDSSSLQKNAQAGLTARQILDSLTAGYSLVQSFQHNIQSPLLKNLNTKTIDATAFKKKITNNLKVALKQAVKDKDWNKRALPVDSIAFIIDGRHASLQEFYGLNPKGIRSISIVTADKNKLEQYNVGNKEAVVLITTLDEKRN